MTEDEALQIAVRTGDRHLRGTEDGAVRAGRAVTQSLGMLVQTHQVHRGVLTVPEGAILTDATGTKLVVVREKDGEKVAAYVPVQLGLRERGLVEVIPSGGARLSEEDVVVASGVGALMLFPGTKLEPRPLRKEFRLGE